MKRKGVDEVLGGAAESIVRLDEMQEDALSVFTRFEVTIPRNGRSRAF